jgi:hypothetical protein
MTFARAQSEADPMPEANQTVQETASMLRVGNSHPADREINREMDEKLAAATGQDAELWKMDMEKLRESAQTDQRQDMSKQARERLRQENDIFIRSLPHYPDGTPAPEHMTLDQRRAFEQRQAQSQAADEEYLRLHPEEKAAPEQQQQAQPQNQAPATFPDGTTYRVTQNQDGTMQVEYITGEKFSGSPLEVTQKIANAHIQTKRWAQQQRAAARAQAQPQPTGDNQIQPTVQPEQQYGSIIDWVADGFAKKVGYTGADEMIADQTHRGEVTQELENHLIMSNFMSRCPDFPNTDEAATAMESVMDRLGWRMGNVDQMEAAHQLAVKNGLYQPLSQQAQLAAQGVTLAHNRPVAPPPPPPGNTVNFQTGNTDPWSMPTDELRKQILSGQQSGVIPRLEAGSTMIPAKAGPSRWGGY